MGKILLVMLMVGYAIAVSKTGYHLYLAVKDRLKKN